MTTTRTSTQLTVYRCLAAVARLVRVPRPARAPYPYSGGISGYPFARDAARWRH